MLDFRSPLILGAVPAGLAVAALAWFAFDGGAAVTKPLDVLEARVSADAVRAVPRVSGDDPTAVAMAAPLFALTTGPGAIVEPSLRLDGVAISPHGQSALLAIGGKPAAWLDLGESRYGITLMEVHAGEVVVDTEVGFEDVALGVPVPGSSLAGPGTPASGAAQLGTAPHSALPGR